MENICVHTGSVFLNVAEVEFTILRHTTCEELLQLLLEEYEQETGRHDRGAWRLVEEWNGCRRTLSAGEVVPTGDLVSLHLVQCKNKTTTLQRAMGDRKRRISRAPVNKCKADVYHFLFASGHVPKSRHLRCTYWLLQQQLQKIKKKHSSTILHKLTDRQPLWGPLDTTPLNRLSVQLLALQENNLHNTNEVADLNIELTRLKQCLTPVQSSMEQLSAELGRLIEEVQTRRKERNMAAAAGDTDSLRTQLVLVHQDLNRKNQVGVNLSSKVSMLESHLATQRNLLQDKRREISNLKLIQSTSRHTPRKTLPAYHRSESEVLKELSAKKSATMTLERGHTLSHMGRKSASLTRRGQTLMSKYRELIAEEGHAFKQQQQQQQQPQSHNDQGLGRMAWPDTTARSMSESVPSRSGRDMAWLKDKRAMSVGRRKGEGHGKIGVRFVPEAVVLNAALEGHLEMMKECVAKVGVGYSNTKGVTCLHNAVCSGNMEAVAYLVETLSCDINKQDVDGWTALHCAVAFDNLRLVRYMIEHGASMFLTTADGDTPLAIGLKEQEEEEEDEDEEDEEESCINYLKAMETSMGVDRNGEVFALFDREEEKNGELGLEEGDRLTVLDRTHGNNTGWWFARNGRGQRGEVPYTFLGPYRRVTDIL